MHPARPEVVRVIDSHTGGEPTRIVVRGGPSSARALEERLRLFREQFDHYRRASSTNRAAPMRWSARCCAAAPAGLPGWRDLLQQRRLSRHVRARHDRPRGHAGRRGPLPPGPIRIERRSGPSSPVERQRPGRCRQRQELFARRAGRPSRSRESAGIRGDVAWGGNWFFLVEAPAATIAFANLEA